MARGDSPSSLSAHIVGLLHCFAPQLLALYTHRITYARFHLDNHVAMLICCCLSLLFAVLTSLRDDQLRFTNPLTIVSALTVLRPVETLNELIHASPLHTLLLV